MSFKYTERPNTVSLSSSSFSNSTSYNTHPTVLVQCTWSQDTWNQDTWNQDTWNQGMDSFRENQKMSENDRLQSYDFDAIASAEATLVVEQLFKIL